MTEVRTHNLPLAPLFSHCAMQAIEGDGACPDVAEVLRVAAVHTASQSSPLRIAALLNVTTANSTLIM